MKPTRRTKPAVARDKVRGGLNLLILLEYLQLFLDGKPQQNAVEPRNSEKRCQHDTLPSSSSLSCTGNTSSRHRQGETEDDLKDELMPNRRSRHSATSRWSTSSTMIKPNRQ
ncbi:hypothetical protein FRC20_005873 [Serendipita sp. 405]|nr:hypothetical protein FRC20_005873 [Serendipita sp. 405]